MSNPTWRAPASGDTYKAGDITQNLFSHPATFIYQGTFNVTGAASSSGTLNTNTGSAAQYIDQPFTTAVGQTTVTRIEMNFQANGTGADTTIGIYADSGGNPTGTALAQINFPSDFEPGSNTTISVPINVSGLTASTLYHIVIAGTASTSNFLKLQDGTTSGSAAQTSPTGVGGTWTTAGKTLLFTVYAGVNGVIRHTMEDITGSPPVPQRWTGLDYAMGSAGTSGPPTTLREFVLGSTTANALRSVKTISYTSGLPTTVT